MQSFNQIKDCRLEIFGTLYKSSAGTNQITGAHNQSRTGDLFITNEALYRLSYASNICQRLTPDSGAGSGNRTRATSLEGWGSTSELYPHHDRTNCLLASSDPHINTRIVESMVEGGGFEPPKLSRQIYSLIPLTTREPLPQELTGCFSRVSKAEAAFYEN